MAFDARAGIIGDMQYIDDTETVTVFQPKSATEFTVENVVREDINVSYESVGQASVPGALVRFWLGFEECEAEPLFSAKIVDADGKVYRVGDHAKEVMRLAYRVDCTPEVVKTF